MVWREAVQVSAIAPWGIDCVLLYMSNDHAACVHSVSVLPFVRQMVMMDPDHVRGPPLRSCPCCLTSPPRVRGIALVTGVAPGKLHSAALACGTAPSCPCPDPGARPPASDSSSMVYVRCWEGQGGSVVVW